MPTRPHRRLAFALLALLATGCSGIYYDAMERLGFEKRDILVDRVENTRESQQEAREQFESALDQFIAVTDFEGGDLEAAYRELQAEYDASEERAQEVRDRIADVEQVAGDLFAEWEEELELYTDAELRRTSARQLEETRTRYGQLIQAMHEAEESMDPVLRTFRDRVLYLKHNLNARAIASLRTERQDIETDVRSLIEDMTESIQEADRFIEDMTAPPAPDGGQGT